MQLLLILFLTLLLPLRPQCQCIITLVPANTNQTSIQLLNSSGINPLFNATAPQFDCSLPPMYTYRQTKDQYGSANSSYSISIQDIDSTIDNITITTTYNNFIPTFLSPQPLTCSPPSCIFNITNNCPSPLTRTNNFDIAILSIPPHSYTYYIICNTSYKYSSIQYGLMIMIIFSAAMITLTSVYSYAWSISGRGLQLNLWIVCGFNVLLIIGGVLIYVGHQSVVMIVVQLLTWMVGIASVWLCSNQILWVVSRGCRRVLLWGRVRVMDCVSLAVGVGMLVGWWSSGRNWIINDIISVAIIVAAIKVLKFVSLKQAVVCFTITISVQLIYVIYCYIKKANYNTFILNTFNFPFQLQIPTINPQYNQKCAWLPVTAIIYPGALMSYMRRFDTSRSTNVYIITCLLLFVGGSFMWMFMSIWTAQTWPYGLIAQPAMLGLIAFFAWKRKEIKILWWGKFIDEEFMHRDYLKKVGESLGRRQTGVFKQDMFEGLRARDEESDWEPSERPRGVSLLGQREGERPRGVSLLGQIEGEGEGQEGQEGVRERQLTKGLAIVKETRDEGLLTVREEDSVADTTLLQGSRLSKQIQLSSIVETQINPNNQNLRQSKFPEPFLGTGI